MCAYMRLYAQGGKSMLGSQELELLLVVSNWCGYWELNLDHPQGR